METDLDRVTRERDEALEERDALAAVIEREHGQQYLEGMCHYALLAARDERMKREGAIEVLTAYLETVDRWSVRADIRRRIEDLEAKG